jgi:hypothetical protein
MKLKKFAALTALVSAFGAMAIGAISPASAAGWHRGSGGDFRGGGVFHGGYDHGRGGGWHGGYNHGWGGGGERFYHRGYYGHGWSPGPGYTWHSWAWYNGQPYWWRHDHPYYDSSGIGIWIRL